MAVNTLDVHASRTAVFDVLADGWTYSNWVVGTSHMRAVEPDWPAVGSRLFHCSGAWPLALRDDTVIEVCEPGRRLTMTASGRPFGKARIDLTLDDVEGGCRITMVEEPVAGPGAWAHNPLSDRVLHRRNTEALQRLAALSERRAAPA